MAPTSASAPVELPALRAAVRPVITLYEGFLAHGTIDLVTLDVALRDLRALPPIGGALGRAVALVAAGGRQATTEQTIAALERLRSSAGLRHAAPPPPAATQQPRPGAKSPKRTTRRRTKQSWTQPPLPGMDGP